MYERLLMKQWRPSEHSNPLQMSFHQATHIAKAKIPKPKHWRLSRLDAPKPLMPSTYTEPAVFMLKSRAKKPPTERTPYEFAKHREKMKSDFPDGWSPPKKLPREAMDDLRTLHVHAPNTFTTSVLAERFKISPEAVRRILKSKWVPSKERLQELLARKDEEKAERRRMRVEREWAEGVEAGVLKVTKTNDDSLELT